MDWLSTTNGMESESKSLSPCHCEKTTSKCQSFCIEHLLARHCWRPSEASCHLKPLVIQLSSKGPTVFVQKYWFLWRAEEENNICVYICSLDFMLCLQFTVLNPHGGTCGSLTATMSQSADLSFLLVLWRSLWVPSEDKAMRYI